MSKHRARQAGMPAHVVRAPGKSPIRRPSRSAGLITVSLALIAATAFAIYRYHPPSIAVVISIADREGVDAVVLRLIEREIERAQADPNSADSHGRLGVAYQASAMIKEAERCYANAAALDPADPVWPYRRAICLQELGDHVQSIELLKQIAQRHQGFAPAQHRFGHAAIQLDDLESAERAFLRTVELLPANDLAYIGLADVRIRQRRYSEARELATKAIALNPRDTAANYLLGLAYRGLGENDLARRELATGASAKSRFLPDRMNRLEAEFRVGVTTVLARALELRRAGRLDTAAQVLERAYQSHPDDIAIINNLAAIYIDTNRMEEASRLLDLAKRIDPGNFGVYINLATLDLRANRLDSALRNAELATAHGPTVGAARIIKADVLTLLHRFEEALDSLNEAARLDARNPDVFMKQGDIYLKTQRWSEARQKYALAARIAPQNLIAHLNGGVCALRAGDMQEARNSLAAAERIDANNEKVRRLRDQVAQAGDSP